jgi:type IV pilus assembly protein PilY1
VNGFVGGINGMDWNRDYQDDAIYFGTVEGTPLAPDGRLMRAKISNLGALSDFITLQAGKPVVSRPSTVIDSARDYWVFAGTGRYFVQADRQTEHNGNLYVGIIEKKDPATVLDYSFAPDNDDLLNTSALGATVLKDGRLTKNNQLGITLDNKTINSTFELQNHIKQNYQGWTYVFGNNQRQYSATHVISSVLEFATFKPGNSSACDAQDSSFIYQFDMAYGLPSVFSGNTRDITITHNGATTNVTAVNTSETQSGETTSVNSEYKLKTNTGGSIEAGGGLDIQVESARTSWRPIHYTW